ncbi:MAG: S1 RNA-binding domain-containing protein [Epulopiscium sp.]|nr:S1 RNA-binding domain-containing protein [Candidatus Epulonipiscium sp.]
MSTKFEIGTVVQGKVTSIKPFGAFVALDQQTQGLVHISQIANEFVKDINDHVSVGDEVSVKILSIDSASGKIALTMRMGEPPKPSRERAVPTVSLEDQLKDFLKQSNERQIQLNKRFKK